MTKTAVQPAPTFLAQIFILLTFLVLGSATATAEQIDGRVVAISDGDTVTVLDADNVQHKIRLAGIDAPEKKQAFGTASRQHLASLIFEKSVTVETTKRDRYGRQVGKIFAENKDIGLAQIGAGLAWHYKAYEREQLAADRVAYAEAETKARIAKHGLWSDANAVPPWEWRRRKS